MSTHNDSLQTDWCKFLLLICWQLCSERRPQICNISFPLSSSVDPESLRREEHGGQLTYFIGAWLGQKVSFLLSPNDMGKHGTNYSIFYLFILPPRWVRVELSSPCCSVDIRSWRKKQGFLQIHFTWLHFVDDRWR